MAQERTQTMAIPAQVQARAEEAERMLKGLSEDPSKKDPEAEPIQPGDREPKPPVQSETDEVLRKELTELKQQYKTLQGKYEKEVKALGSDVNLLTSLKNQVRQLTMQNSDLTQLISDMRTQLEEKKEPAKKADIPQSFADKLSDEDLEYLENEGITGKVVDIVAKTIMANQPARNDELERIKKDVQQDRTSRFWSELNGKVENWRHHNESDGFNDWLDVTLPYSSSTRRQVLQSAQQRLDYETVIQLFKDFEVETGFTPEKGKAPMPKVDPGKLLEPDASVSRMADADADKPKGKVYTKQEIRDFYARSAVEMANPYTTAERKAEIKRLDEDIIAANREGRIT